MSAKNIVLWVAAFVIGPILYGAGREAWKWWRAYQRGPGLHCERCGNPAHPDAPVHRRKGLGDSLLCPACAKELRKSVN